MDHLRVLRQNVLFLVRDQGRALKITSHEYLLLILLTYFQKINGLNPKRTSQKFSNTLSIQSLHGQLSQDSIHFSGFWYKNGHYVKKMDLPVQGGALCRRGKRPRKGTLCTEAKAKLPQSVAPSASIQVSPIIGLASFPIPYRNC